ncbi:MAG: hypothetical protein IJ801_02310 [Lachnospiraceae bacterium]|nr:hypothetical protein [Lachnospiraceae bacterium]
MNYKDFKITKHGKKCSIGKFTEQLFAMEILTGYGNVPEYRKISKAEFNTFDIWKDDKEKIKDILNRPVFCSGYENQTDFDEKQISK